MEGFSRIALFVKILALSTYPTYYDHHQMNQVTNQFIARRMFSGSSEHLQHTDVELWMDVMMQ